MSEENTQKQVVIYSTSTCPYCDAAKNFFNQNGVAYVDYNVGEDHEKAREMVEISGQMGVPVIIISDEDASNEEIIVGFDEARIRQILGM